LNGFIIGNGESRRDFNLNRLRGHGPIYGCNALYRDFIPDLLVAVDAFMYNILERDEVYNKCEIVRRILNDENGNCVLQTSRGDTFIDYYKAASGQTATWLMLERFPYIKNIFLIGFDIYSHGDRKMNNMYKDTEGYAPNVAPHPNSRNWVNKLGRIMYKYTSVLFYRVGDNLSMVPEWEKLDNVRYISYNNLEELLS